MESNPQFNLRWNNHSYNIIQVFLEQLTNESLVDVTLSCQGQFIKVHKMVLSACSPYFQDLFSIHQVQHPVVILNGIKFHDLKMVVDFMYRGETRVLESELNDILAVAETLQIKGLSTVRNKHEKTQTAESIETSNVQDSFPPEVVAMDPLELTNQNESIKPPRKRKRPSEGKRNDTSKVSCQETSSESAQPQLTAPRPNHNVTPNIVPPKVSSSRVSSPAVASPRTISPRAVSPGASSPMSPPPGVPSSKPSSPKATSPKAISSNPHRSTLPLAKVYLSKKSAVKANKEVTSSRTNDGEQEDTDALPFVQVSLSETSDDDIDLAKTIKVNPLFIRDIDDGDASWDDPTRLVIDLPSEEADEASDKSQAQHSVAEKNESKMPSPIKTTFVAKPKLKVRPTSELVGLSQSAQSSSDSSSVQERNAAGDKSAPEPNYIDQRRGHRIPRPPNAFMIFANEWRKKLALENPTESNKQISVRLGIKWKSMTSENKAIYFTASRKADEEHKQKYPNYFYSPKEARIRKSQMQALRQKHVLKTIPIRKSIVRERDPLELTPIRASDLNRSTVLISDVTNSGITVKEEILDEESNPQNLEEEFLKMVEDGQVEAELQEDDSGNSVSTDQVGNSENTT
ncbi:longitudinals lacking protein, isoforms A/B/D/L-like isoform X2 [Thrips palmi]|nr:longitudinals lacking protein, isoforms A/B/D/L-like isoform X2 [Thrips palmi]XP_034250049.1 longitudinals lacking protein, isoforms A/B/D/L-like isoform X2 [Thrips palmi]